MKDNLAIGVGALATITTNNRCLAIGNGALADLPFICDDCGVSSDEKPDGWFGITVGPWDNSWCDDCKMAHASPDVLDAVVTTTVKALRLWGA